MRSLFALLAATLLACASSSGKEQELLVFTDSIRVEATCAEYSFRAPPDTVPLELSGTDSCREGWSTGSCECSADYGGFSSDLSEYREAAQYQELQELISDRPAKLVTAELAETEPRFLAAVTISEVAETEPRHSAHPGRALSQPNGPAGYAERVSDLRTVGESLIPGSERRVDVVGSRPSVLVEIELGGSRVVAGVFRVDEVSLGGAAQGPQMRRFR